MKVEEVGHAALSGWKQRVADAVARRAPFRDDQVRASLGLLFLALSVRYLVRTTQQLLQRR
ncbi:MAG: hypothetical protein M3R39_05780 [Actinomycetota bacterium]|nr:hypothetical protein [Actinomycetota bacterium]